MRIVAILIGLAAILGHHGTPLQFSERIAIDPEGNPWRLTWIEASKAELEIPALKAPEGYFFFGSSLIPIGPIEPGPDSANGLSSVYDPEIMANDPAARQLP